MYELLAYLKFNCGSNGVSRIEIDGFCAMKFSFTEVYDCQLFVHQKVECVLCNT